MLGFSFTTSATSNKIYFTIVLIILRELQFENAAVWQTEIFLFLLSTLLLKFKHNPSISKQIKGVYVN